MVQEEEDRNLLRAAARARQLHEEGVRIQQDEGGRRRGAEREHLRRLRGEQDRWQYAEQERYARARQANIPRRPRHAVFVHQDEDRSDRGERFIQDAIRAENLRQFERRVRWPRGGYDDGALRRRNTVDGDPRWYDGQRWRWDRW